MESVVTSLLLCQYLAEPHRFDQAVSTLALELYDQAAKAPAVRNMCNMLIMGNTATKRTALASLEENYTWA